MLEINTGIRKANFTYFIALSYSLIIYFNAIVNSIYIYLYTKCNKRTKYY